MSEPILLCRTADSLYWVGRYLERAEGFARLVVEHTALLVDLPTTVPLTWEPLLAVPGADNGFAARYPRADESSIMQFLLANSETPSSLRWVVARARENLRVVRQVMPRSAWRLVNELASFVEANAASGWRRGRRQALLDRVIGDCQQFAGVVAGSMRRDHAYEFFCLGTQLERADMTTRVLDVRAAALMAAAEREDGAGGAAQLYEDLQWLGVLRSLVAQHSFRRATSGQTTGDSVVSFLLCDDRHPRSVAFCLDRVAEALARLPHSARPSESCLEAQLLLATVARTATWTAADIHDLADEVQLALAKIDGAVRTTWFEPAPVPGASASTGAPAGGAVPPPAGRA
jgi:uncharacterized alpha-E superfamily protein